MRDIEIMNIEKGVEYFYKLKYTTYELSFDDLHSVLSITNILKPFQKRIEEVLIKPAKNEYAETLSDNELDNIPLDIEYLSRIDKSLKKYFRNDFTRFVDRRSIGEYLSSKQSLDFHSKINYEITQTVIDNPIYRNWLQKIQSSIERLKDWNRYSSLSISEILFNVDFESFKDDAINNFIREFLISELEYSFALIHIGMRLGLFQIVEKSQKGKKQKPELTINQIALKYVYSRRQITRGNGNETAKKYGHNSGEKLFQRFTYYSSSANRTGKPNLCTPKTLINKINLIESVIELLPSDKQERAKDEVSILKKIYEAEYQ